MRNILLIRLSSFGDILLTTPAIRCLKKSIPDIKIDFLTLGKYASLLEGNSNISNVIKLDNKSFGALLSCRRSILGKYSYIADFHVNYKTTFISVMAGAKRFTTKRYDISRRLLVASKKRPFRCFNGSKFSLPPVPLRHIETISPLGIADDGGGLEFFATDEIATRVRKILDNNELGHKSFLAIAPFSQWPTKEWPLEHFRRLIELMPQEKFVILGNSVDKKKSELLVRFAPERTVNLSGFTDPATACEIIRSAKLLVSNDSGLMHAATAVETPVIALFGCTVRGFGFFPFRTKSIELETDLPCRPCATKGLRECPIGTLDCLMKIEPETVVEKYNCLQTTM